MDEQFAIDIGREALMVALKISLPLLLIGLIVGVCVSIIQAATQIQEQTLSFVPKILAVILTLFIALPWIIRVLTEFTLDMFEIIGSKL